MKHNLWPHHEIFPKSKSPNEPKAATIDSYNITEILAQEEEEETFEDGNVIKKCLVAAGNLSFN
jgi:hypothetical protein